MPTSRLYDTMRTALAMRLPDGRDTQLDTLALIIANVIIGGSAPQHGAKTAIHD